MTEKPVAPENHDEPSLGRGWAIVGGVAVSLLMLSLFVIIVLK